MEAPLCNSFCKPRGKARCWELGMVVSNPNIDGAEVERAGRQKRPGKWEKSYPAFYLFCNDLILWELRPRGVPASGSTKSEDLWGAREGGHVPERSLAFDRQAARLGLLQPVPRSTPYRPLTERKGKSLMACWPAERAGLCKAAGPDLPVTFCPIPW